MSRRSFHKSTTITYAVYAVVGPFGRYRYDRTFWESLNPVAFLAQLINAGEH